MVEHWTEQGSQIFFSGVGADQNYILRRVNIRLTYCISSHVIPYTVMSQKIITTCSILWMSPQTNQPWLRHGLHKLSEGMLWYLSCSGFYCFLLFSFPLLFWNYTLAFISSYTSPLFFPLCVFHFVTSPVLFSPHSTHLFLVLSLVCLYIVFVPPLVSVSSFCDVLHVCSWLLRQSVSSWLPCLGLSFLVSPIWYVFGFLLLVLIWTLLFLCMFFQAF